MRTAPKNTRTFILGGLLAVVFIIYCVRLMQLQIVRGDEYLSQLDRGFSRTQVVQAARGEILDRNMEPLVENGVGLNIVFSKAYMTKETQNGTILKLIRIMRECSESWNDSLPLTETAPFTFTEDSVQDQLALKSFLNQQEWATADDVVYRLREEFELQDYSDEDFRAVAGVRYEMAKRSFSYQYDYTFAEDISITTAARVQEWGFDLPGVNIQESPIRQYVAKDLAPHVIGTMGRISASEYEELKDAGYGINDMIGKSGVEKSLEDNLRGKDGERRIDLDSSGDLVSVTEVTPPEPGNTIQLTIDSAIQRTAQQALADQIALLQATAPEGKGREADVGAVVAIEVKTGKVLAMASHPGYDLSTMYENYNAILNDPLKPFFDRATMGTYAAGSTFKPAVALAGLTEKIITPATTVFCGRVYDYYSDYTPTCLSFHGATNVLEALRQSCNIFFYDVGRQLGIERITHYASQLGLGKATGIQLPNEASGHLSTPEVKQQIHGEQWYPGDVLQASIGQMDHRFTPLQLASYCATIASRGKRMQVSIVDRILNYSRDEVIYQFEPVVTEVSDADADAFATVIEGMRQCAAIGTSSQYLGDYPISIAAKTGTPETAEYPNSTFIAFAPVEDPEIAVAVVIEKGWHGYTGAPIARKIFDAYFFPETAAAVEEDHGTRQTDVSVSAEQTAQNTDPDDQVENE